MSWRLIDIGPCDAARNMALDDVLLESRSKELVPNTFRFLQFNPSAVLVGYHQSVENEVRVEYCNRKGLEINRRLTGGGAILFDPTSLGWEIIASKRDFGIERNFFDQEKLFNRICDGAINGLKSFGINAKFRPKNDIEVNGKKISGTGGTEREGAFLFQGTLLVDVDVEMMLHALKIPLEKLKDKEIASVRERVTTVYKELGSAPSITAIKRALIGGFQQSFDTEFTQSGLIHEEEELLRERLSYFSSYEWVYLERSPGSQSHVYAITKSPGGIIRVSLSIDSMANTIKTILITGDFFIYPQRAIPDLEAALKGCNCDYDSISYIVVDVWRREDVQIPGVEVRDIVDLIIKAIRKTRYETIGLTLTEANKIFEVEQGSSELLNEHYSALLLPYCAKLPTCNYREKDSCLKCGKCTVGDAYKLAEDNGLTPITIVNFEDLMEKLAELKRGGVNGYIGCCCEGFYCKHKEDFEKAGLKGLLVDISDTTCYDLGKEHEALLGDFESQTSLDLVLLDKLLKNLACGRVDA